MNYDYNFHPYRKRIFITGGAGYLGKSLIKRWNQDNEITVFSRDEAKHYFLKKEFPKVKFIVGDVRNYDLLKRASANHDIGIFAASLKQIEACDDNYEEANQVIVQGAFNSKRCALEHDYECACFISTDKSRAATTVYGAMKYIAGETFINNPIDDELPNKTTTRLSSAIYGNILNSTGSVIPLLWQSIQSDRELVLFHPEMTRFLLTIDDAMNLIQSALKFNGVNVIPKCSSLKIKDLFEIFNNKFGLKWKIGEPRTNEKIHEIMIASEELPRVRLDTMEYCYIMDRTLQFNQVEFPNNEYSSKDSVVSISELEKILEKYNFFKP